jgi:Skp family chaperone for outer membrane proteins
MKRRNAALLLCFAPILAVVAHAQSNIVTVSFNAAVLQTAEAQKDLGTLQARFAPRQAQLQALDDEVEALRKQVSDNKLSEASEKLASSHWTKKRSSFSARAKISGTIRRPSRSSYFSELRKKSMHSCRAMHSSVVTQL